MLSGPFSLSFLAEFVRSGHIPDIDASLLAHLLLLCVRAVRFNNADNLLKAMSLPESVSLIGAIEALAPWLGSDTTARELDLFPIMGSSISVKPLDNTTCTAASLMHDECTMLVWSYCDIGGYGTQTDLSRQRKIGVGYIVSPLADLALKARVTCRCA